MAQPRVWTYPEDLKQRIAERALHPISFDEAETAFARAGALCAQAGGVVKVAALRAELEPDVFYPVGYSFHWESFAQPITYKDYYGQDPIDDAIEAMEREPEPVGSG